MGQYNTRETIRESSPAINPVFSRACGEFNNKTMMTEHVDNFKMSKQDQTRNENCKSAFFFCDGAYS